MSVRPLAFPLAVVALSASLAAQDDPPVGAFELGGGVQWIGGSPAGSSSAMEASNRAGGLPGITLFEADARLRAAPGVGARIGYALTRRLAIEGGFTYSRPAVATTVRNDFEGAPQAIVRSALHQYFVDVGVTVRLEGLRLGARAVPFVAARAGYLRHLTEDRPTFVTHLEGVPTGRALRRRRGVCGCPGADPAHQRSVARSGRGGHLRESPSRPASIDLPAGHSRRLDRPATRPPPRWCGSRLHRPGGAAAAWWSGCRRCRR